MFCETSFEASARTPPPAFLFLSSTMSKSGEETLRPKQPAQTHRTLLGSAIRTIYSGAKRPGRKLDNRAASSVVRVLDLPPAPVNTVVAKSSEKTAASPQSKVSPRIWACFCGCLHLCLTSAPFSQQAWRHAGIGGRSPEPALGLTWAGLVGKLRPVRRCFGDIALSGIKPGSLGWALKQVP